MSGTPNQINTSLHEYFLDKIQIAVIGLGYVGLPLAVALSQKYLTIGFDTDHQRITELESYVDSTNEVTTLELEKATNLKFTYNSDLIRSCTIYIVAVPTPIDAFKRPELSYLLAASRTIGQMLKKGDLVIYESTVYPGCTEEDCVPVLVEESGLQYNQDFFCGYSPERINPGDPTRPVTAIKKVTSGSTPEIAEFVDQLYRSVITAGTFKAASIKVAEASKAIENAQRDVNISFMNELALLFDRLGIDTQEVLEAASTKWNFLNFRPGLVGGHCISVDPYYLLYKAESVGYYPEVLLSGRRINDQMSIFIANKLVKLMIKKGHRIEGSRVLILGITYKENCPDVRNSKVVDIIKELTDYGIITDVWDPVASPTEVKKQLNIELITQLDSQYEAIVLAVSHNLFHSLDWENLKNPNTVIFDVKNIVPKNLSSGRL
ncbi:Vi polysaccharide biosynthesis protein VipA/TviB [Siphonobacter sp. BAB-5405]|uniref:nucleotide sugar dehydrogenase n=1 Tax=Siphonobacter sp. BAB-5405 TaxID=1864825 RepID=UPI000C80A8B4|nr:nucleotide sugar dehydrogenase [Siphonobacter sp. BAB-5405]PMD98440.1 Vi polysaccharide biosynthesis protein VipA/TviB [Siphonobacter sp. BAB-5405]